LVLAVMALLMVAHLLTTSTRRRRRDLAILKTVGFAHGDVGRTVAWQATTLAAITLIAAVPSESHANVISIGPAVTAMRTHPASVLREE
jgi:predicted lysophospholipase L1 biosynthesis ABC-type transport system permease subunit